MDIGKQVETKVKMCSKIQYIKSTLSGDLTTSTDRSVWYDIARLLIWENRVSPFSNSLKL